jgi:hypothetical protein
MTDALAHTLSAPEPFWGVRLVDGSEVVVRASTLMVPAQSRRRGATIALPFADVIGARLAAGPSTEVLIAEVFEPTKKRALRKPVVTDHITRKLRLHKVRERRRSQDDQDCNQRFP